jgi:hypothetical protein
MGLCQKQGCTRSMMASKSTSKEQKLSQIHAQASGLLNTTQNTLHCFRKGQWFAGCGLSTGTRSTSQSELGSGRLSQFKASTDRDRRIRWYCLHVCSCSAGKDLWDMEWRTCAYYQSQAGCSKSTFIHLLIRPIRARDSFSRNTASLTFSALVALPLPLLLVVVIFPCMLCMQSSLSPCSFLTFPYCITVIRGPALAE